LALFGLLVSGIGLGCGTWNDVQLTASYGECTGYCTTAVELDTTATGHITYSSWGTDPLPTVTKPVSHPDRADALDAAVRKARAIPWADHYGCPDCADQGAYQVVIDARATVLDPSEHPDAFDDLVAFFAQIRAENPAPARN